MDGSFLSDEHVIAASQKFVCIRLATYEDKAETEFLQEIFSPDGSRLLENTVFTLLAPDGQTKLCPADRSPHMVYGTPRRLAAAMERIATRYPGKGPSQTPRVPQMKNFRLAVNVAACDGLPLVVGFSDQESTLQQSLSELAFDQELAGRFHYFATTDAQQLKSIKGFVGDQGFYLLGPDNFGVRATIAEFISLESKPRDLGEILLGYSMFTNKPNKSHHSHVQAGLEAGIDWKTEVPVTDAMSEQARKRADRRRKK